MPKSKRIVVDASVARSAGWETTPDPHARQCRDVLEAILKICHQVVLSAEGLAEWKKHRSGFARSWQVRMTSRRKMILIGDAQDDDLRARLAQLPSTDKEKGAMEKDAHLLEAALATDGIVLSRDEIVRDLFRQAATQIQEICPILWANPTFAEDDVLTWLERGAKMEPARRLETQRKQAILFTGIQATGKSSFYRKKFSETHVWINLDTLKSRQRERLLLSDCLQTQKPFVVDNTNLTRKERAAYIEAAKTFGFRVIGYYFPSSLKEAIARNVRRPPGKRIPPAGLGGAAKRLEIPSPDEGYDALYYVSLGEDGSFVVQEWQEEPGEP